MKKILLWTLSAISLFLSAQTVARTITIENRSTKPVETGLNYKFNDRIEPFTESFAKKLDVNQITNFTSGLLNNEVQYTLDDARKITIDSCKDDACKDSTAYLVVLDDKICRDISKELPPAQITITNPVAGVPHPNKDRQPRAMRHSLQISFTEHRTCSMDNRIVKQEITSEKASKAYKNNISDSTTFFVVPNQSLTLNTQRTKIEAIMNAMSFRWKETKLEEKTYPPYTLKDLKPGQKVHLMVDDSGIKEVNP